MTESAYRKKYSAAKAFYDEVFSKMPTEEYSKAIMAQKRELERAKIAFRDERNAWQKQNYADSRVIQKLDLLESELKEIGKVNFATAAVPVYETGNNDLLVILSDLHIGQCFSSAWGEYNSDIAKKRLNQLLESIISIKNLYKSKNCYISLQGDLISNSIHKTLAITNRENVIKQIKLSTEYIASFCMELSHCFSDVYLQSVCGNHSRIDRKDEALHDERLDDLISWAVDLTLDHIENFHVLENNLDIGISEMSIRNKLYVGVHGDFDPFSKQAVANLITFLGFVPYAITYGHLHTCAVDEANGIKMVRGGSLAGSGDDFTIEKRLSGKPSQMVCVCTENGIQAYHPIELI